MTITLANIGGVSRPARDKNKDQRNRSHLCWMIAMAIECLPRKLLLWPFLLPKITNKQINQLKKPAPQSPVDDDKPTIDCEKKTKTRGKFFQHHGAFFVL